MSKVTGYARLKDMEKMIRCWPDYSIIGNRPYAKGCFLIKKAYINDAGTYVMPKVLLAVRNNFDMMQLITSPGFSPEMALSMAVITNQQGLLDGDVILSETALDRVDSKLRLLCKAVDLLNDGRGLAELFLTESARRDIQDSVERVVGELKIVYRAVRREASGPYSHK